MNEEITWIEKSHIKTATKEEVIEFEGYNRGIRDALWAIGDERYKKVPLDLIK